MCPVCGKGDKEWIKCRMRKEVICYDCHKICKHNRDTHNGPGCGYDDGTVSLTEQIRKLNQKLRAARQTRDFYYERGWKDLAQRKETAIKKIQTEIRELEEKENAGH